jgi:hypothetical protein
VDPATLAGAIVAIVRPFIRGLWSGQESTLEHLGERAGEASRELAERVWRRLFPSVQSHQGASVAARELGSAPDDDDLALVFQLHVKKLLEGDRALAEDLAHVVDAARGGDVAFYGDVKADRGGIVAGRVDGGIHQTFRTDKP